MSKKVAIKGQCEVCGKEMVFEKVVNSKSFITSGEVEINYCPHCGAKLKKVDESGFVKCPSCGRIFFVSNPKVSQNGQGKILKGKLEVFVNPRRARDFFCPICGARIDSFRITRKKV